MESTGSVFDNVAMPLLQRCSSCKLGTLACMDTTCRRLHIVIASKYDVNRCSNSSSSTNRDSVMG